MVTAITKRLFTLPDIAVAAGLNLDLLRKRRREFAAEGLITKVGSTWIAEAPAVDVIVEKLKQSK